MKTSRTSRGGVAVAFALPLLIVMGCKDHDNATVENNATAPVMSAPATNDSTVRPDNSEKNTRDRNDMTLTPGDQGSSDADRDITQKVRRSLTSSSDYSTTAKNIKIITANGKVTLRGPVNTDAEKTGIAGLAEGAAGAGNVDNQLEVKASQ